MVTANCFLDVQVQKCYIKQSNVAGKLVNRLNKREELLKMAEENQGVLLSKHATTLGFSRSSIKKLSDSGDITQVQRGIYVTKEGYVDDFFLIEQKFKKGIFSHETALYLLGFSDRAPIKVTMTFEHGRSTTDIKAEGIRPIMVSKHFLTGKSFVVRNGLEIRVYNIERTLVDLLKPRYDTDREQLIPALKRYAAYDKKDVNKLFRYAKQFGVEEQIRNYMGVLL